VVLEHPASLPYGTPYAGFLFPTWKNNLKRPHFETLEEIQKVMMAVLNNMLKNDFWKCLDSCKQCENPSIVAGIFRLRSLVIGTSV
jgi:hypothetical protein